MSGKAIRETAAALGVIASMVFVGWEIRQNTTVARAAAYQEIANGFAGQWYSAAFDPEAAVVHRRGVKDVLTTEALDALTDTERYRIVAMNVAAMRQHEVMWRQVQLGLLDPSALSYFGMDAPVFAGVLGANIRLLWPDIEQYLSPDYAEFMERQVVAPPLRSIGEIEAGDAAWT